MGEQAGSRRGVVVALAVGAAVVVLVVGRSVLSSSSSPSSSASSSSSGRDRDGAVLSSSTTTEPRGPTTTAAPPGPIPGLTAVGVTEAMARVGWTCFQDEQELPGYVSTACLEPGNVAQLAMLSTPAGQPVYVETTIYVTEDAAQLQRVASLGWTGVDAEAASSWIEASMDSDDPPPHRSDFGGVPFELQGMPGAHTAWYLAIGREPLT